MKQILIVFLLLLYGISMQAQNPEYPCGAPQIISRAVVLYEGYATVYLKFDVEALSLQWKAVNGGAVQYYSIHNGELLIPEAASQSEYEILATDNCGELTVLDRIKTSRPDIEKSGIVVSDILFKAIATWQDMERTERPSLFSFIQNHEQIPQYEKIAFIQKFYFGGQPFSPGLVPPAPPVTDECLCNLVLKYTYTVSPGVQSNGHISPVIDDSNGEIDFDDDSGYFYYRQTSGAAKYNFFRTQGWKDGTHSHTEGFNTATENLFSPNRGQLSMSYVCDNGTAPDRECPCTKKVTLTSEYDSRVRAMSHILGGTSVWERKSWALTEDMAVVTLRKGDSPDTEILAAGKIGIEAECNSSINEEFFVKYVQAALQIATTILYLDQGGTPSLDDLLAAATNIATGIGEVITTTLYFSPECDELTKEGKLILNNTTIELAADERFYYDLYSFSNQQSGGKRSWESESQIWSSFYMVATVEGGASGDQPRECCTNTLATWLLANEGGPTNDSKLKQFVGNELTLAGGSPQTPWLYLGQTPINPDPFGILVVPSEYGFAEIDVHCDFFHDPNGGGGERSNGASINGIIGSDGDSISAGPHSVKIYDLSGKLLYSGADFVEKNTVNNFLQSRGLNTVPGIYLVQMLHGTQSETVKVVVPK